MASGADPTGRPYRPGDAFVAYAAWLARDRPKTRVLVEGRLERWEVPEAARRAALIAVRAAAAALGLTIIPHVIRWHRPRRHGDMDGDTGLLDVDIDPQTGGFVTRDEPGTVTFATEYGNAWADWWPEEDRRSGRDALLFTAGHEVRHLKEYQDDDPADEERCNRAATELLPQLRAATAEGQE